MILNSKRQLCIFNLIFYFINETSKKQKQNKIKNVTFATQSSTLCGKFSEIRNNKYIPVLYTCIYLSAFTKTFESLLTCFNIGCTRHCRD